MNSIEDEPIYNATIERLKEKGGVISIVVETKDSFIENLKYVKKIFAGFETEQRAKNYLKDSTETATAMFIEAPFYPLTFYMIMILYGNGQDKILVEIKEMTKGEARYYHGYIPTQKYDDAGEALSKYFEKEGIEYEVVNHKTKSNPVFLPSNFGLLGTLLFSIGTSIIGYIASREVYKRFMKKEPPLPSLDNPHGFDVFALADNNKIAAEISMILNDYGIDAIVMKVKEDTLAILVGKGEKEKAEEILEKLKVKQAANQPEIQMITEDVGKAYETGQSNLIGAYIDGSMGIPYMRLEEGKFNMEIEGIIGCKNDKTKQETFLVRIPAIVDEWMTTDLYDDILSHLDEIPKWAEEWKPCLYIQITNVRYKPAGLSKKPFGKLTLMNFIKGKIVKQNRKTKKNPQRFKEERLTCPYCGSPLKFYDLGNLEDGNVAPIFYCEVCKKYFADR